jgi:hypothetical protein
MIRVTRLASRYGTLSVRFMKPLSGPEQMPREMRLALWQFAFDGRGPAPDAIFPEPRTEAR